MNVSANLPQNKDLNQILQSYQLFSMNALGGPAHHFNTEMAKLATARFNAGLDYKRVIDNLQHKEKINLPFDFKSTFPPPATPQKVPLFMQADRVCQLGEANLEGKKIACFTIGGEKRLCLPQVLNTVLPTFSLEVINQACDDLQIYCSRCNGDQLETFKKANILPGSAYSCGLITMTDAERLCSILLHANELMEKKPVIPQRKTFANEACIPVYHECFGNGYGYLKSALYEKPDSECIECADCGKLLSTTRFVGHSHKQQENRVCHWGFDRENWKCYILINDEEMDEQEKDRLEKAFDEIINRFGKGVVVQSFSNSHGKRKESYTEGFSPIKVACHQTSIDSAVTNKSWNVNGYRTSPLPLTSNGSICSKSSESPMAVVEPERIVSATLHERFEKKFIPTSEVQRDEKEDASPIEKPLTEQMLQRQASPALSVGSSEHNVDDMKLALQSLDKMKGIFMTALATAGCSDELSGNIRDGFISHLNVVKDFIDTKTLTDK